MSMGPVSGNGIDIRLPPGKVVFWSALVQSGGSQFVQLKDAKGTVVFTTQGASTNPAGPTQIGQGFFQIPPGSDAYKVYIGIFGGEQWSQVIWNQDAMVDGTKVVFGTIVFGAEDGQDGDFNDLYLRFQWLDTLGSSGTFVGGTAGFSRPSPHRPRPSTRSIVGLW